MKIVFIGASKFGLRCLEDCLNIPEINIAGILTAPPLFKISYSKSKVNNILHADFEELAIKNEIPLMKIEDNMKSEKLFEQICSLSPDLFLVVGWYHMIPKSWREFAPAYGLHASLLPKYAGGAPLVWAMINGESETGITFFKMEDGVDCGDIIGQEKVEIDNKDTIKTLYSRIEDSGMVLIKNFLPKLAQGNAYHKKQNLEEIEIWPQRSPSDGLIKKGENNIYIERFIRAQTRPYPGAFMIFNKKKLIIWKASLNNIYKCNGSDGNIVCLSRDQICLLQCINGSLILEEIQVDNDIFIEKEIFSFFSRIENENVTLV